MLFRTILFNFIVFIDCSLQIPRNVSKRLFSAYQTYQYDCKNKQKNVGGAKKSYLYVCLYRHNLMPRTLEIVFQSFQISNFSGGGGGGMHPDPPSKYLSLPSHTFSNWLPTSNFVETPDNV